MDILPEDLPYLPWKTIVEYPAWTNAIYFLHIDHWSLDQFIYSSRQSIQVNLPDKYGKSSGSISIFSTVQIDNLCFVNNDITKKILIMDTLANTTPVQNFLTDDHLTPEVKDFLKGLNNGGPGLESFSAIDARQVLVTVQAGVNVDYSGITESEKLINADGFEINLNIVRPEGVEGVLPVFIFIHGRGGDGDRQ